MPDKETKRLLDKAEKQGFVVKRLTNGHFRISTATGQFVTVVAGDGQRLARTQERAGCTETTWHDLIAKQHYYPVLARVFSELGLIELSDCGLFRGADVGL